MTLSLLDIHNFLAEYNLEYAKYVYGTNWKCLEAKIALKKYTSQLSCTVDRSPLPPRSIEMEMNWSCTVYSCNS